jgi:hypothetical protein
LKPNKKIGIKTLNPLKMMKIKKKV